MNEIITKDEIENMIYEVRGRQVMLDSDLAKLYGVETKRINEAVRNNPQKFPERFSWKLTAIESKNFLVENFDQKNIETRGGRFKNQRVFTEQGLETSFNKLEEKRKTNEIYFNGQIYDAYSKIQEIFKIATKSLIIIDAYADNTILDIIKRLDVNVVIITKKDNLLTTQDIIKYNKQYHNLKVIYDNSFHDRYFIIDKKQVYHYGASINRIGYKTFSITLVGDEEVCKLLIDKVINS